MKESTDKYESESERLTPHAVGNVEPVCTCNKKNRGADQHSSHCMDANRPHATGNTEPMEWLQEIQEIKDVFAKWGTEPITEESADALELGIRSVLNAAIERAKADRVPSLQRSEDGLLPCPFCGCVAEFGDDNKGGVFITCTNQMCLASSQIKYPNKQDVRPLLVEVWNNRTRFPAAASESWQEIAREIAGRICKECSVIRSDMKYQDQLQPFILAAIDRSHDAQNEYERGYRDGGFQATAAQPQRSEQPQESKLKLKRALVALRLEVAGTIVDDIERHIYAALAAERKKLDAVLAQQFDLERLAMDKQAELTAERQRADNVEAEEVRRIKHLNRLGSWAQQDPTGPTNAARIQEWVLTELKAALGSKYKPTKWQPEYFKLKDQLAAERQQLLSAQAAIEEYRAFLELYFIKGCLRFPNGKDYRQAARDLFDVKVDLSALGKHDAEVRQPMVDALKKAADTFTDLKIGLRFLGKSDVAKACQIAEEATRDALVKEVK